MLGDLFKSLCRTWTIYYFKADAGILWWILVCINLGSYPVFLILKLKYNPFLIFHSIFTVQSHLKGIIPFPSCLITFCVSAFGAYVCFCGGFPVWKAMLLKSVWSLHQHLSSDWNMSTPLGCIPIKFGRVIHDLQMTNPSDFNEVLPSLLDSP